MKKAWVIEFFGSRNETAAAIGCTPQAISVWPDDLPPRLQDRVIAAAFRMGKELPRDILSAHPASTFDHRSASAGERVV